ncbi:MAG: hypothetical protein LBK03_00720 [Bacteroidales bacterium]|jgi:hypothetical protein|nr:hypothetical protein [Bacteroidales bacterium]
MILPVFKDKSKYRKILSVGPLMRLCFTTALALFLLTSCHHRKQLISFEGTLAYAGNAMIYLAHLTSDGLFIIDSCPVEQGRFKLAVRKEPGKNRNCYATPSFYRIQLTPKSNYVTLPAKAGDKIVLTADARDLVKSYTASGNTDVQLMQQLDHRLKSFIDSTDQLQVYYVQHIDNDSARMYVEKEYNQLVANHTAFLQNFITQNSQSMVTVMAFYQMYNQKKFFSEIDDLPLLQSIYTHLNRLYPQNEHVLFLKTRIEK